jgi:hypothetical protein
MARVFADLAVAGVLALLGWWVWRAARTARTNPDLLYPTDSPDDRRQRWEAKERARRAVLWLQLSFLLVLLALAFWYWQASTVPLGTSVKVNLYCFAPNPAGGVPLEVPWFGALGAVMLSLQGVFQHRGDDWDVTHHAWHVGRPIVGALVGVVGFYLFVVAITATGSDVRVPGMTTTTTTATTVTTKPATAATKPGTTGADANDEKYATSRRCETLRGDLVRDKNHRPVMDDHGRTLHRTPDPKPPQPKDYVYFAVAFVLGYREETFRSLVKRLVDVVLTPPEPNAPITTAASSADEDKEEPAVRTARASKRGAR